MFHVAGRLAALKVEKHPGIVPQRVAEVLADDVASYDHQVRFVAEGGNHRN
jgi:hypothetical protein